MKLVKVWRGSRLKCPAVASSARGKLSGTLPPCSRLSGADGSGTEVPSSFSEL